MDKNGYIERNASKITEAISPIQPQEITSNEVKTSYSRGLQLLAKNP